MARSVKKVFSDVPRSVMPTKATIAFSVSYSNGVPDLAARVAQRLALPMETISIVNADRIPALQQDRVDLVASGITRAENRKKDVGFSLGYLVSPHKVLIRRDGGIRNVDREIVSVEEIFRLQRMDAIKADEGRFLR